MSFQNARIISVNTPTEKYFAEVHERGTPGFTMSSSAIKEFLRCPHRWKAGYKPPESESKDFGSLLDTLIMAPEQFASRYVLEPSTYRNEKGEEKPWSNNANICKAWKAEQGGKQVIKRYELADAQAAAHSLLADETLAEWNAACDRQVWVAGEWHEKRSGMVIPVKCLVDYAPKADSEFHACLGDLKTATSGALQPFQRQVFKFGYHIQAALYLDLFNAATGEQRVQWCFAGLENYTPWEPFKRMLSEDFIDMGRSTYRLALERYGACLASGRWPGYDAAARATNGWSLITPEPWMAYQALEESMAPDHTPTAEEPSTDNDVTP